MKSIIFFDDADNIPLAIVASFYLFAQSRIVFQVFDHAIFKPGKQIGGKPELVLVTLALQNMKVTR